MQHESHIDEKDGQGPMTKIIAVAVVLAGLCAIGAYVVYGSGMWNPPVHQVSN